MSKPESRGGGSINERASPRVALIAEVRITIDGVEQLAGLLTDNISEGGVFIRTETPLAIGRRIHLAVNLRNCEAILEVDGEVAWTRTATASAPAGMGVRFVSVPSTGKELIKGIVTKGNPV